MITRCPQCHAWFRVTVEHLREANGFVTCGECDAVFSALTTLIEETGSPDAPQHAPVAETPAAPVARTSAIETAAPLSADPSTTDFKPLSEEKSDAIRNGAFAEESTSPSADTLDPESDIAAFEEVLTTHGEVLEESAGQGADLTAGGRHAALGEFGANLLALVVAHEKSRKSASVPFAMNLNAEVPPGRRGEGGR